MARRERTAAPHRRLPLVGLVLVGGAVGTGARHGVGLLLPTGGSGWPTATFIVNVVGSLALGVLLEALTCRGPETLGARAARLSLGTGVLGSFTTYSALATEVDALFRGGSAGLAVAYALLTVVAGVMAALVGVAVGAGRHRRRALPDDPDAS